MNSTSRVSRTSNRIFLFVVLSMSLALLACGGGGGGSGNPPLAVARNFCAATPVNQTLTGTLPGAGAGARFSNGGILPSKASSFSIDVAGNYSYAPKSGVRGMDKFSYRLSNGGGTTEAVATVLIDGAVRIMPLGDSITEGVTQGGNPNQPADSLRISYRKSLYEQLSAAGYSPNFVGSLSNGTAAAIPDPQHEGHPGWCDGNRGVPGRPQCSLAGTQPIDTSVNAFLSNHPADLILLHIGTNDLTPDDPSGVASILDNISSWAVSNYPVSVFVARIIPTTDGRLRVNDFNNNVARIATDRPSVRVFMVDQQSVLHKPGEPKPDFANPALMASGADTLHPNQFGYDRMADRWKADMVASGVLPSCE